MDSLRNKQPKALPKIVIEVFFGDCSDKQYQGKNNSDKPKDACGIKFSIEFNEAYQKEHEEILKQKEEFGLPLEYYEARWESFAFERITLRTIPVKSSLIDASEYKVGYNLSDICTSHIIKNQLETSLNSIASEARSMQVIIENLLQISRYESGRLKPEFVNVNVFELFERLQREFMHIDSECPKCNRT